MRLVSLHEGIRQEGLNYGMPSTFVRMGEFEGDSISSQELLSEIVGKTKCPWVYFYGSGTLASGMGVVIQGLSQSLLFSEVSCDGLSALPGYVSKVDMFIVEANLPSSFNYGGLRRADMIRIKIHHSGTLHPIKNMLEVFGRLVCTKCLVVDSRADDAFMKEVFLMAKHYDKTRIYVGGEPE